MYDLLTGVKVAGAEKGARGKKTGKMFFFGSQSVGSRQSAVGSWQSAVNSPFLGG